MSSKIEMAKSYEIELFKINLGEAFVHEELLAFTTLPPHNLLINYILLNYTI